jgi:hypothetical protein
LQALSLLQWHNGKASVILLTQNVRAAWWRWWESTHTKIEYSPSAHFFRQMPY